MTLAPACPESAPGPEGITRCASWRVGDRQAAVACWGPSGRAIQCCGHGLLSCAAAWLADWGKGGLLLAGDTEIPFKGDAGLVWLAFPPAGIESCQVPAWTASILGEGAQQAALSGPDDGYLVLEYPPGTRLSGLRAPGAALEKKTARALIVSCRVTIQSALAEEQIHFRYFAPQYGMDEDAATGSAMRVLASYWQSRGLGDHLKAVQCSPEGGLLLSRMEDGHCWVGGHVIAEETVH